MSGIETVLVTGGSGFVGGHCIVKLLEKGYSVRTTIRSLSKKEKVLDMLKNGGITSFDRISFCEADLTEDANWHDAVKDCEYVLHVASPILFTIPKDENEMIRPAVDGTLRVLKAARDGGVRRVVMTSNFGAVGYSHKDPHTPITEKEWTDPNEKHLTAYNKSKVLAERAAWDFVNSHGKGLELVTINPTAIYGPALCKDMSVGFELLKKILDGSMRAIPQLSMNVIDVRDVADLHIRAMTSPKAKGQRFLALAGGEISLPEIANFLRARPEAERYNISNMILPNWVAYFGGLFNQQLKTLASMLKTSRNASNEKAKTILDWEPIATNEEAIIASVESMLNFEIL
ncbi:LADA_0G16732g1_1 [Lachancea dasiensis]|uniref:LADA_0G16732g1_1 n=1 Tax=Lachancea dasiensis TaxID=1072105 RepID=A0A1G4JX26_9SACH|nr:LADA_0G16732g1_1 [Lachancea dasiensis]